MGVQMAVMARRLAVLTGLEPAASALTGRRANQTALQDRVRTRIATSPAH